MSAKCAVCNGAQTLIFSCSGGADVGALSDLAARNLSADGAGRMFCLAGLGGRVEPIMKTTGEADRLVAIDGCPMACARKTLEQAGFTASAHVVVTGLGMEKGASPATDERVAQVADAVRQALSA